MTQQLNPLIEGENFPSLGILTVGYCQLPLVIYWQGQWSICQWSQFDLQGVLASSFVLDYFLGLLFDLRAGGHMLLQDISEFLLVHFALYHRR
jgi:hypothetical protein